MERVFVPHGSYTFFLLIARPPRPSSLCLVGSRGVALLSQFACRGRKVFPVVQDSIRPELGIPPLWLEAGGGREHIQEIGPVKVGGGADTGTFFPRFAPVPFLAHNAHEFPAMRLEHLLPGCTLVANSSWTRTFRVYVLPLWSIHPAWLGRGHFIE